MNTSRFLFPVHLRDGIRLQCPYSGVPRVTDDEPCPNGCTLPDDEESTSE